MNGNDILPIYICPGKQSSYLHVRSFQRALSTIVFFLLCGYSTQAQPPVPGIRVNGRIVNAGESIQICIGTTLQYEDSATRASFINWRFKNGSPATYNSFGAVSVQYNTAGSDTTFQRVIRGTDTASEFVIIKVGNQKPTASFSYIQNDQCGNVPVVFNGSISTGNSLTYAWDFNDGSTSTTATPEYPFLNAVGNGGTQNYDVKLVVKNNLNCYDSITKTITVKKIPDASLGNGRAEVIFGPFNGQQTFRRCASLPFYDFQFTNASTTKSFIVSDTIAWGEGSPDSVFSGWQAGTLISHTFPFGKSNMKVTAVGSNGCIGVINYIVFVGTTPAGSLGNNGENSVCAYSPLTFPLHDFGTNASGTTYSFSVNDGSALRLFQHPPPDSITHFFNYGSCGNISDAYSNAYKASLFIENPCGSSTSPIVPLYVSDKPRANLDIYPSYNVCTNAVVTLSNASNFGGQITPTGGTGSTCENKGKVVWQISPSTGYTIVAGDTGSINDNRISSVTWTNGSAQVNVIFNTPGVYSIKVFAGNDRCGIDSFVKTVCVRLPPKASFTMDKHKSCAPDSVLVTNTSAAAGCLGDTYKWDVFYSDPQNCGASGGYSFTGGTSASSKDPLLLFTQAGRYIIKLTVTATGTVNTCPFDTYQDTIWIKAKPQAIINPVSAVCIGNDIVPAAVVNNCYSDSAVQYKWTFAGGTPSTSKQLVPGNISYSATGNYLIKFEASNECGVTPDTDSARITSTPAAIAGADRSVCSGTPVQLGAIGATGISYTWKPGVALSSTTIADPILNFDYNGPGADTILTFIITASAGSNCFASDTVSVKIRKNPVIGVNPVFANVCQGLGILLVATGAGAYTWTPAAGLNIASGDSVIAAPASTTQYSVTGTAANGCTAAATTTVSVTDYATVDAGADTLVCNKSSAIQLTGTPAGGTWNGHAFVTSAGIFNAAAAGNGTYKVYYTAGTGVCTTTDSAIVQVTDVPIARAGNDTLVCQGTDSLQLTGYPAGGRWRGSLVTMSGIFDPSVPGIYEVIYMVGGGTCTAEDTLQITVAAGITNNVIGAGQSICTGTRSGTITGQNATGGNSAPAYQWQISYDNMSWSDIPGAVAIDYQPDTLTTTTWFRRIASTILCKGAEANISQAAQITANPNATAAFSPTAAKGCVPFSITPAIINLTPFSSSVGEYRWYVNGSYIGSGENFPGYTMNTPGDSITVRLIAVSAFGCIDDTAEHGFTTIEKPVPSFTQSDTAGCGPLSVSLVNTTPAAEKYSFQWDFGQQETSLEVQPPPVVFPINPNYGDTAYTITLNAVSACETISAQQLVKVSARPKALFTPDKSEGCSPMKVNFTNTSRGSNGNYIWDFGDNTPLLQSNSASIPHTFTTGVRDTFYVKLKGSNECGMDSLVYAIVVNPNSIRIDFALNGNEKFGCAPHTVNLINNTSGANSFLWNFGDGSTLTTSTNIDTIIHTYTTAGDFTVNLFASNSCTDTTTAELVTVQVKPAVGFTPSSAVSCITDTIHFINNSDTGISYQWRFGDGATSVIRNPQRAYSAPGIYHVSLTGSRVFSQGLSCSDSAFADIVIQDTLPGDFTASDTVGNCTPLNVTFQNNTPSVQTNWTFGDGSTATGGNVTHTYTAPGLYQVVMISRGSTGCTLKATKVVTVTAPSGSLFYNSGFACTGDNVRFEVQATNASQYTFLFGDGDSLTTATPVISHQYVLPGRYIPSAWLIEGSCRVKVYTGDTIKADRMTAGFAVSPQFACGTTLLQFTDTSYSYFGITSWNWNFGDGTASSGQNPVKTYTQDALNYVQLSIGGVSGCTDTFTVPIDIHVRNFPVSNIGSDTVGCTQQTLPMQALVVTGDSIAALSWNFGNGVFASGRTVQPVYNNPGFYTVSLMTSTVYGCADTVYKTIRIEVSPDVNGGPDVRICRDQSAQLNATGATAWRWSPVNYLSCTACPDPLANPPVTTAYSIGGTNAVGCSVTDTVLVEVVQPFAVTVSADDTICTGGQTQLFAAGATNYLWSPASGLSSATAPNPAANPTVTTPYRVIAGDAYNCFADTGYVTVVVGPYPTVALGAGMLVVAGTAIPLSPLLTNGPFKKYTWSPQTGLSCTNCVNPVATIDNNITYQLQVENIYGCIATDTVSYQVKCEDALQVFIPNAFSPDGDHINDVLMVRGKGLAMVKYFRVFNRWGELVFERNNFSANDAKQGWDGKVRGIPANPDVYVYTAEMICTAGGTFNRKGNVTLFR